MNELTRGQMPNQDNTNTQKHQEVSLEKATLLDEYISSVLFLTTKKFLMNGTYMDIMAYAPGENEARVKIWRTIGRLNPLPSDPKDKQEISFHDELGTESSTSSFSEQKEEKGQLDFNIFVDKETFEYSSTHKKPEVISEATQNYLSMFKELAKQKGAKLYVGDIPFVSDGNGWIAVNSGGAIDSGSEE